jgi:hypothetical protein
VIDGPPTMRWLFFTQGRDFSVLSSRMNVALCSAVTVGKNLKRTAGNQSFVAIEGGVKPKVGRGETYVNDCHCDGKARMLIKQYNKSLKVFRFFRACRSLTN